MMACEALGMADLSEWYALPEWVRNRWLAHTYAKLTGQYDPPTPGQPPSTGGMMSSDILAQIEAQRQG